MKKIVESSEFKALDESLRENQAELDELTGADQRQAGVWFYERTG